MPTRDLTSFEWASDRLRDAMRELSNEAGFESGRQSRRARHRDESPQPGVVASVSIADLALAAGLDVQPIDFPSVDLLSTLRRAAPVVFSLPGHRGWFAALSATARTITLVGPEGRSGVLTSVIEDAFWAPLEADTGSPAGLAFSDADDVSPRRRIAAGRVLLAPSLAGRPLGEGWMIRPISSTLGQSLRGAKVYRRFGAVIGAYLLQFALFIAIWRQVGSQAFGSADRVAGDTRPGWGGLFALLGGWVIVQLVASAAVSGLALDVGARVRAGLLRGALQLDPGRIRAAGVGQLLGRALDADTLDTLALGGGVEATAGIFEVILGAAILALGATPWLSVMILAVTLGAIVAGSRIHARRLVAWSHTRRELTHDLVERMVGHRTALIQDRPARRAAADQVALARYDARTQALDRAEVWLAVGLPRGWLLASLLALAPLGVSPAGVSAQAIPMSVGGVWLVYGALRRLGIALPTLAMAREAWGQIAPLVGSNQSDLPVPVVATSISEARGSAPGMSGQPRVEQAAPFVAPLVEVRGVSYQYAGRAAPVLKDVNLQIAAGDRILVEGISGGGKSTLAALVTGLKTPGAGSLLLRGADQRSIGLARWRRAIGGAPQFHDNHVLGADMLFNLLMGRRWPPRIEDLDVARGVCAELGLGPLLARMPAGLQQQVGETGWQLSHGERSRLFIARSLLQVLDMRVLDESFAALDPETLDEVMTAVLSRPEALIVIAHP
jgi:ATP-binding cassette, subfamily B, bacterial